MDGTLDPATCPHASLLWLAGLRYHCYHCRANLRAVYDDGPIRYEVEE